MKLYEVDMETRFEEFLDQTEPTITICGIEFTAGKILRQMDPIAFRIEYSNWIFGITTNGELDD